MLEWIELSAEATIVASQSGASLHQPQAIGADPFREPMRGAGSPETTRFLLEGCIALAARSQNTARTARVKRAAPLTQSGPSCGEWAYRLAGYFHTTHATRRILPELARRFASSDRLALRDWARQKTREEAGHDELALRDLASLGYDARRLVHALCPPRAAAWVALFESLAASADPVGCIGYAHALERLALLRGPAQIAAIEQHLPAGVDATRCLRVHSAAGSDEAHVDVNISTAAASSADERRTIAAACHATALIYFDPALSVAWSAALDEQLTTYRARTPRRPQSYPNPTKPTGAFDG